MIVNGEGRHDTAKGGYGGMKNNRKGYWKWIPITFQAAIKKSTVVTDTWACIQI